MHPETLKRLEAGNRNGGKFLLQEFAARARHFHVTRVVAQCAYEIGRNELAAQEDDEIALPATSRLPAEYVVLSVDDPSGTQVVLLKEDQGWVIVIAVMLDGSSQGLGAFEPGSGRLRASDTTPAELQDALGGLFGKIAFILSLINEPRLAIRRTERGCRNHRRAVQRASGLAASAWTTVSWEVGADVASKYLDIGYEGHPKALHWCRAHYRSASKDQPKAQWLNLPRKGGWGWYCWVKDCWKGHPAYGIKLQRHEPRMPGELRSSVKGMEAVLPATKLAALGAAQRASMVEAGFASSAAIH